MKISHKNTTLKHIFSSEPFFFVAQDTNIASVGNRPRLHVAVRVQQAAVIRAGCSCIQYTRDVSEKGPLTHQTKVSLARTVAVLK